MVISCSQINELEKRFAHLLLPIRDLTKNWDVNIASDLEDYLDEIEHIQISFDNGATVMNFAEAALVIQGSTSVYSRKVEYLYSLTFQVLSLIASKKKLKNAALDDGAADKDVVTADDTEEEFLSLDDTKEHKNIDIKNDEGNLHKSVCAIPITPMSLIPLTDEEKGEYPLLSKRGEIVASRRDFRMNTSTPHQCGLMLLEMTQSNLIHCSFMTAATSTPLIPHPLSHDAGEMTKDIANDSDEGHHSLCSVDGHDDACEVDMNNDADASQTNVLGNGAEFAVACRQSERDRRQPPALIADIAPQSAQTVDPHTLHDPHDAGHLTKKPICKGKPFRLPASLKRMNKRKKEAVATIPVRPQIYEAISKLFDSNWAKLPKNPLKVLAYTELEDMFWEEHKRRQAYYKNCRHLLAQVGRNEELREEAKLLNEEEDVMEGEDLFTDPNTQDDYDDGDQDPQPVYVDMADIHGADHSSAIDGIAPLHGDLLATTIEADVVSSFEKLVREHVEGFLIKAQLYTNRTHLERRVAQWEERIGPILEEEETRGTFDIHSYGAWILERMTAGQTTTFKSIVCGQRAFETCRLFLATLQLANNYNVEIEEQVDALEERMNSMRLSLLSSTLRRLNLAET